MLRIGKKGYPEKASQAKADSLQKSGKEG